MLLSTLLTVAYASTSIYNGPIWGSRNPENENAIVRDNALSCKLDQIEVCTYQDEMCFVKLQFDNCENIEESVKRCEKSQKFEDVICNSVELDAKITKMAGYKDSWLHTPSGFKLVTEEKDKYTLGEVQSTVGLVSSGWKPVKGRIIGLGYTFDESFTSFHFRLVPEPVYMQERRKERQKR